MKNKRLLIIALVAIAVVVVGASATYAFFTSTDSGNQQVFTTGTLKITYDTGADINTTNAVPTTETNASLHTFTVKNDGTINAGYSISFSDISLTKDGVDTTSSNLMWKLYKATVEGSTYTTSGDAIASGVFGENGDDTTYLVGTDTEPIISGMNLNAGNSQAYVLKLWLNETNKAQNEDQGLSFSATIKVDARQQ